MSRMHKYLGQRETNSCCTFVYSNFNYTPLVFHFTSNKRLKKVEKTQKPCLRLLLNNQTEDYAYLLKESKSASMEVRQLRIPAIEIFKTLNGLNLKFMADTFHHSLYSTYKKCNLYIHNCNKSKYGDKSFRFLRAHMQFST